MSEIKEIPTITGQDLRAWWNQLSSDWRNVFCDTVFNKDHSYIPLDSDLYDIAKLEVLRIAGPSAMNANTSITLNDLSGIRELKKLTILIVTHHNIKDLEEISEIRGIKTLIMNDNSIENIEGIGKLVLLEECYLQNNKIQSIKSIEKLNNLKTLYCNNNEVTSLDGINKGHSDSLINFYCLPNPGLSNKEVMICERDLYIKCRKG